MKKTTSLNLSKKLASYGALTASIIGVADASGQSIIYTDVNPDFSGTGGSEYLLDIDNNGTNDFRIHAQIGSYYSNLYLQPLTASNEALGSGGATYAYPFALSNNDVISSGAGSWFNNSFSNGAMSLNYYGCSFGNWCNTTDGYLGLRFNIAGSGIHYGWIRLDVGGNGSSWTIKDYAYHDTPGSSILAGQQSLSVEGFEAQNQVKIVALNQTIGLYNLPNTTKYSVFNMAGKVVLNGTTENSEYVIEANNIASGVYILELTDQNTNAVIRKKVVL